MARKSKQPEVTSVAQVGDRADDAIKTALRNKLRTRMKVMSMSRQGGTRQEITKVVQAFNDDDATKLELMKEVQEDVKDMKPKKAKKFMRKVMGTMDSQQKESFVDMVKDKLPTGQSKDILDFVKRAPGVDELKSAESKSTVNPETVYTPVRLMTNDQKAELKAKRAQEVAAASATGTEEKKKKKKKFFKAVPVNIPKLNELNGLGGVPLPTAPPAPKSLPQVPLFEKPALPYRQRLSQLSKFSQSAALDQLTTFAMESAGPIRMITFDDVRPLTHNELLLVPESVEPCTLASIPEKFGVHLIKHGTWAGDTDHSYIYQRLPGEKYVRAINAHKDAESMVRKFAPVMAWLQKLQAAKIRVPLEGLVDMLSAMGVVEQTELTTVSRITFRLHCAEYKNKAGTKTSVPLVPYVQISFH